MVLPWNYHLSPSNAPHMHALKWALAEADVRREAQRLREEATLHAIFEEAGGCRDFLAPGETLRGRAQKQLLEETEGAANLARLRARTQHLTQRERVK